MTEQKKAVCCICGSVPDFERGVCEKTPSLQYVCAKHVEYVERGHRTGSWVPFGEGTGVPVYHIEWCEHLKQFVATCEDFLCREHYGDTRSAALAEMLKNIERMSKDGVA